MNNSSDVLIVIDMQPFFLKDLFLEGYSRASSLKENLIKNCYSLIREAIKNNNIIIFIEYQDGRNLGDTISILRNLTNNYNSVYNRHKSGLDGSEEIKEVLRTNSLNPNSLVITGIYTDQCVYSTVLHLINKFPDTPIVVHKDACAAQTNTQHDWGLERMEYFGAIIA